MEVGLPLTMFTSPTRATRPPPSAHHEHTSKRPPVTTRRVHDQQASNARFLTMDPPTHSYALIDTAIMSAQEQMQHASRLRLLRDLESVCRRDADDFRCGRFQTVYTYIHTCAVPSRTTSLRKPLATT